MNVEFGYSGNWRVSSNFILKRCLTTKKTSKGFNLLLLGGNEVKCGARNRKAFTLSNADYVLATAAATASFRAYILIASR
jgi:hypothetical protein